jgi:uncharacterized protein YndB with AHSA1/START domain
MKSTYSTIIKAPVATVFELIDDPEKTKLWIEELVNTEYPEGLNRDQPVGTKFKQQLREGRKVITYDGEVTAYEKLKLLAIKLSNPDFQVSVSYHLTPVEAGTQLDYEADFNSDKWYFKLFGPLFKVFNNSILRKQMAKLTTVAEAR